MSGFETQTRTQEPADAAQARRRARDGAAPRAEPGAGRAGTGAGDPSPETGGTGTDPAHAALLGAYWLDGPPHGTHACDRCRRLRGPSGQEVVRTVMLGLAVVTIVWGALLTVAVG
ncbi:hypothetical protein ACIRD2_17530 [Streptomyces sp. NPDC093595]|uniref:hypothetical protein n=1 Tax=Streptomyces sp. NPDC093595 TaxID=3366045 RepID=UPI00380155D6